MYEPLPKGLWTPFLSPFCVNKLMTKKTWSELDSTAETFSICAYLHWSFKWIQGDFLASTHKHRLYVSLKASHIDTQQTTFFIAGHLLGKGWPLSSCL